MIPNALSLTVAQKPCKKKAATRGCADRIGRHGHISITHLWVALWQSPLLCEPPSTFPSWPSARIALIQAPQSSDWEARRRYLAACSPADERSLHNLLPQQLCDFRDIFLWESPESSGYSSQGGLPISCLLTLSRELGTDCTSAATA